MPNCKDLQFWGANSIVKIQFFLFKVDVAVTKTAAGAESRPPPGSQPTPPARASAAGSGRAAQLADDAKSAMEFGVVSQARTWPDDAAGGTGCGHETAGAPHILSGM